MTRYQQDLRPSASWATHGPLLIAGSREIRKHQRGHWSGVGILDGKGIGTFQGTLFPEQETESLLLAKFGPQDGTSDAAGSQEQKRVKRLKRQ